MTPPPRPRAHHPPNAARPRAPERRFVTSGHSHVGPNQRHGYAGCVRRPGFGPKAPGQGRFNRPGIGVQAARLRRPPSLRRRGCGARSAVPRVHAREPRSLPRGSERGSGRLAACGGHRRAVSRRGHTLRGVQARRAARRRRDRGDDARRRGDAGRRRSRNVRRDVDRRRRQRCRRACASGASRVGGGTSSEPVLAAGPAASRVGGRNQERAMVLG